MARHEQHAVGFVFPVRRLVVGRTRHPCRRRIATRCGRVHRNNIATAFYDGARRPTPPDTRRDGEPCRGMSWSRSCGELGCRTEGDVEHLTAFYMASQHRQYWRAQQQQSQSHELVASCSFRRTASCPEVIHIDRLALVCVCVCVGGCDRNSMVFVTASVAANEGRLR